MEQMIIVGIIVLLSAGYLLRKFVFKPKSGGNSDCGGCNGCGGRKGGCH